MGDKEGVDWIQFLRGYIKCCGRMPALMSLNKLYKLYVATCSKAGLASKLELEFESDDTDKVSGYFTSIDVVMFLWIRWAMSQNAIMKKLSLWEEKLEILDMNPLALSAITSCTDDVKELNVWDCCVSGLDVQLPAQKLHMWVLSLVPSLAHCFKEYVDARFRVSVVSGATEWSIRGSSSSNLTKYSTFPVKAA
ncbi:hypothetical protein IFM89_006426 [Coptis chinensis]|uniref:Uncharacterized protein n=1 Tax=Coptis chinensis TaxID=261450 RepID=A0A835LTL1_9MAGN|nr:hypothetical protein IFM89_006426 [Coptis chinensis]